MKYKWAYLSVPLIFVILIAFFYSSNIWIQSEYDCKSYGDLPEGRAMTFNLQFVDENGDLMANTSFHVKQIRQDFLMNNREAFTNYSWIETTNSELREFESKRDITAEIIIDDLNLISDPPKTDDDMFIMLNIPVSFPEKVKISDYEDVETNALEMYAEAFDEIDIAPDYIQILTEFNQKMQLNMGLDLEGSIAFADRYIRKARELFPDSELILSLGPLYCYEDFYSPPTPGGCIEGLRTGEILSHVGFIERMEALDSPYDIIGIEYQIGSHHSPELEHFEYLFDDLSQFGKRIFIWEYWVMSEEVDPGEDPLFAMFMYNRPEGGWTEEYQAGIFEGTFEYIDQNPLIMGMTQFGWKDGHLNVDNYIFPCGIMREDGSKKPSYYILEEWYESWFTECDIETDDDGRAQFYGMPGLYQLRWGTFSKAKIEISSEEQRIIL